MRPGVLQLHRWGLLERLRETGPAEIRTTTFVYGDETVTVPIQPRAGVDALYAPRRRVLDPLLADAAAAAGAEVRFGPRLIELVRDRRDRVTGAVIEERDRSRHTIGARIVIGADGLRSTVARLAAATTDREGRHAAGVLYTFWRGRANGGNRWHYRPGVAAGEIPTHDGLTCIFTAMPASRFHDEIPGDLETGYRRVLSEVAPELARELAGVAPAEPFRGFPGQVGLMRRSHGPGWALVGDAGYFKDPITAHGISDALRDAELLARAVAADSDEALAGYQTTRDALSGELFEITDRIAGFAWELGEVQDLHRRLSRTMNAEAAALVALDAALPPAGGRPAAPGD
jgi:flavin-dependent dehydrogenase